MSVPDARSLEERAGEPSRALVLDREGTVTFSMGLDEQRLRPEALRAVMEDVVR